MIYFVVAQKEEDGEWKLFGPWDYIEGADNAIAVLTANPLYDQLEIARVLTDEDKPDIAEWLDADKHEGTDKPLVIRYPDHWPKRYNACTDPCDIIDGPCACGTWHGMDDDWVKNMIAVYGIDRGQIDFPA